MELCLLLSQEFLVRAPGHLPKSKKKQLSSCFGNNVAMGGGVNFEHIIVLKLQLILEQPVSSENGGKSYSLPFFFLGGFFSVMLTGDFTA